MSYSPSFAALRTLEAVCRLRSATLAGKELGVTHSAVSQHIHRLEDGLQTTLFVRRVPDMVPTPTALKLAAAYNEANRVIEVALSDISTGRSRAHLVVTLMPSMARLWLAPRLVKLRDALPDLVLDIRTSRTLADLEMDEADIAIRFGSGRWPRLTSQLLFEEEFFAVCSPQFVIDHDLKAPADLARAPLVIPDMPPWSIWFEAAGLEPIQPEHTFLVDDAELALQAAVDGLAAALVRRDWAAHDMAAGRLVSPFPVAARTGAGCYLVWREGSLRAAEIKAFGDWVAAEFGAMS